MTQGIPTQDHVQIISLKSISASSRLIACMEWQPHAGPIVGDGMVIGTGQAINREDALKRVPTPSFVSFRIN